MKKFFILSIVWFSYESNSDANKRKSHLVFQDVYYSLLKEYHPIISDSRQSYAWENKLEIIDSITISLFKDILSCVGRKPNTGKRKGGIKVHTQINLQGQVPKLIWFSPAVTHDKQFLKHVQLEKGKIAVFDKGYNDYKTFDEFTENGIFFVTRLKSNAAPLRRICHPAVNESLFLSNSWIRHLWFRRIAYPSKQLQPH